MYLLLGGAVHASWQVSFGGALCTALQAAGQSDVSSAVPPSATIPSFFVLSREERETLPGFGSPHM